MFTMDMLAYMLLLLFMLFSTSSVFVFHMLVADVVMFNILELIMKLLPNFPTTTTTERIPGRCPGVHGTRPKHHHSIPLEPALAKHRQEQI